MRPWSMDEAIEEALDGDGIVDTGYGEVYVGRRFSAAATPPRPPEPVKETKTDVVKETAPAPAKPKAPAAQQMLLNL